MRISFACFLTCLWVTFQFLACHPKAVPFSESTIDTLAISDTLVVADEIVQNDLPVLVLTLGKTGCYGNCPAYDLKIYSDRSIIFHGRENVSYLGYFKSELSDDSYQDIFINIEELDLINYPSVFPTDGTIISDLPKSYLEFIHSEGIKGISINHSAPLELNGFIDLLENQIDLLSWTSFADPTNSVE